MHGAAIKIMTTDIPRINVTVSHAIAEKNF